MAKPKQWIDWPYDDCERCGGAPQVLTAAKQEPGTVWVGDGDEAKCLECGLTGAISCDAETAPWIQWEEEE